MPVIKPYIRQKTIPAGEYAKAPDNLTAGPALALAKGAEEEENILIRHMAKMKEEEDNLAIVDAAITIGEKEIAFRKTHDEALSKATSYDDATEITKKLTQDFVDDLNKHVESASNNKRKIGISKLVKSAHLSVLDKTAASLAIARKSYIDASIMQTGDFLVNEVREGLILPEEALDEYDATVRSLKPAGEADKISYIGQQKITGDIFEYKIKNNPSFVRELAKDPEKKKWWFDRLDPDKHGAYESLLEKANKDVTVTDIVVGLQKKYVDNPANAKHKDGEDKTELEKRADAWGEITSTAFLEKHGADIQRDVKGHWADSMAMLKSQYEQKAENIKGALQTDIIDRKLKDPSKDPRWKELNFRDRGAIKSLRDSQIRMDRAEANAAHSLALQARAMKKQDQQEEATIFYGKALAKIVDGTYTDTTQIIKDFSKDNPYIQKQLSSVMTLFNQIENSPDLKAAIKSINSAATKGLLGADQTTNLLNQGLLLKEMRSLYLTNDKFRGHEIDKWLEAKLKPEVKKGFGGLLSSIFRPTLNPDLHSAEEWNTYGTNEQIATNVYEKELIKRGYKKVNGQWVK